MRKEKQQGKPPSVNELQTLAKDLDTLPDQYRRGLVTIAPGQFQTTRQDLCEVNLAKLTREEFVKIRKYLSACKHPAVEQKQAPLESPALPENTHIDAVPEGGTEDDFLRRVRRGQAEIMQARGYCGSESSSSDSECECKDNGIC